MHAGDLTRDLRRQVIQPRKALLGTDAAVKGDAQCLPVDVAVKIEQVRFDSAIATAAQGHSVYSQSFYSIFLRVTLLALTSSRVMISSLRSIW
jgi:hypothetical protein